MNLLRPAALALAAFASVGCTTLDVYQDKAVKIGDDVFYYNEDGQIEMSAAKLDELVAKKQAVRIKHVSNTDALILDPEELAVLMKDQEVFFSKLDNNPLVNEESFLVSKGSLKENMIRLAQEAGWETIQWDSVHNYYVESPVAIAAESYLEIAFEMIAPYPLMASFAKEQNQLRVESTDSE